MRREQSGRALTAGEYAAVLAARDRQRSGQARGGSRHSSASREVMRDDSGAPLQVRAHGNICIGIWDATAISLFSEE